MKNNILATLIIITFLIACFFMVRFMWERVPRYEVVERIKVYDLRLKDFNLEPQMKTLNGYCEEIEFDCEKPCMTFDVTEELEEVTSCSQVEICVHKTICYIKKKIRKN